MSDGRKNKIIRSRGEKICQSQNTTKGERMQRFIREEDIAIGGEEEKKPIR